MSQFLAIEWDEHEARFVVASGGRSAVTVRAAGTIPLVDVAEGGSEPQPDLVGSLRAALAERKLGRATTLVGVARSRIELLHLTLPPAADHELPELVHNQAMRESHLLGDDTVLDFVPLGDRPGAQRRVMAAAVAPQELERICNICAAAGLRPRRLLFRPLAAVSLFVHAVRPPETVCLLVCPLRTEADLTIVVEGRATLSRTIRLPATGDRAERRRELVTEIQRTLAVLPAESPPGDAVEAIYLCGNAQEHSQLAEEVEQAFSLPVRSFDPFEAVRVAADVVPEHPERFAGLLGMIADEASGRKHALDFLHPRKVPEPPNRLRVAAAIAGLVALLLVAAGYTAWTRYAEVDRQNDELAARLADLNSTMQRAKKQQAQIAAVANWLASDVNWLEELRDLSLRLPSSRNLVLLRMSMTTSSSGGGYIGLQGLVRDPKIVDEMERRIRDPYRRVRTPRVQERGREGDYAWAFESTIAVVSRSSQAYLEGLAQAGAVGTEASHSADLPDVPSASSAPVHDNSEATSTAEQQRAAGANSPHQTSSRPAPVAASETEGRDSERGYRIAAPVPKARRIPPQSPPGGSNR